MNFIDPLGLLTGWQNFGASILTSIAAGVTTAVVATVAAPAVAIAAGVTVGIVGGYAITRYLMGGSHCEAINNVLWGGIGAFTGGTISTFFSGQVGKSAATGFVGGLFLDAGIDAISVGVDPIIPCEEK